MQHLSSPEGLRGLEFFSLWKRRLGKPRVACQGPKVVARDLERDVLHAVSGQGGMALN